MARISIAQQQTAEGAFKFPVPTSVYNDGDGSGRMCYDRIPAQAFIDAGLLRPEDLPTERVAAQRRIRVSYPGGEIKLGRCKDGSINAWFPTDCVLSRTRGFKQFLGGILADTRLSLVRYEKLDWPGPAQIASTDDDDDDYEDECE